MIARRGGRGWSSPFCAAPTAVTIRSTMEVRCQFPLDSECAEGTIQRMEVNSNLPSGKSHGRCIDDLRTALPER